MVTPEMERAEKFTVTCDLDLKDIRQSQFKMILNETLNFGNGLRIFVVLVFGESLHLP